MAEQRIRKYDHRHAEAHAPHNVQEASLRSADLFDLRPITGAGLNHWILNHALSGITCFA